MSVVRCVALAYLHSKVPYSSLREPPRTRELRVLKRVELVADDSLEETGAIVNVTVDGQELTERGNGRDLLYPDWDTTSRDLDGIAARSEASAEVVACLHAAIEGEFDLGILRRLLEKQP